MKYANNFHGSFNFVMQIKTEKKKRQIHIKLKIQICDNVVLEFNLIKLTKQRKKRDAAPFGCWETVGKYKKQMRIGHFLGNQTGMQRENRIENWPEEKSGRVCDLSCPPFGSKKQKECENDQKEIRCKWMKCVRLSSQLFNSGRLMF